MLTRFFGKDIHSYIQLTALLGLSVGLPLSRVVLSISTMLLLLNLLLEADFKAYYVRIKKNKPTVLLISLFILHFIGLAWSDNIDYGIHDIKAKLPLIVIPLVLAAKPIKSSQSINIILLCFLGTMLITSVLNFAFYQHWIGSIVYDDIRGMSIFASHTRYALFISMAVAISFYLASNLRYKLIGACLIIWFSFYTFYSQILTGAITYVGVLFIIFAYYQWKNRKWIVVSMFLLLLSAISYLGYWLSNSPTHNLDVSSLPTHTKAGNPYIHHTGLISAETGKSMYWFYCEKELVENWPIYSEIHIDSSDAKDQRILATLTRYLSSKDLPKDAEGLKELSEKDIDNIENGIGSAYDQGILARLYGIKYEIINGNNPNGNSLLERFHFWKTGKTIFLNNIALGVGTGDVQDEFNKEYLRSNSALDEDNWLRGHNMFLTMALTFGVFGLALFLLVHFAFLKTVITNQHLPGLLFMTIILLSYLTEDTLETQLGVTFFSLFFGLFSSKVDS